MNSYDVQVHGETDNQMRRAKKVWAKPSIEIIALKAAEAGIARGPRDGGGCHATICRS